MTAEYRLLSPSQRPLSQGAIVIATNSDIVTDDEDLLVDNDHLDRGKRDER